MQRLAGLPIFSAGEREFIWEHVVLAGYLWGEIAVLERRIGQDIAAQNRLEELGEPLSDDDVEDASNQWRYAHDLISADDLESWLSARRLTLDEWLAFVHRRLSAARSPGRRPLKRHAPRPDAIDAAVLAEAMCSGTLTALAARLAGRAAVFDRLTAEGRRSGVGKAKLAAAVDRLPRAVRQDGLFSTTAAESVEGAEFIASMDVVFERFLKTLPTEQTLAREIEAHALEWTHVQCKMLTFDSEATAREAALLVREDGLSLTKAAAVAQATVAATDLVLEDVGTPLKDRLVSAQPGDLVGPVEVDEGFVVTLVTRRVQPSVDDREIRERARDRVGRRAVGAEIEKRIRWHERF